MSRDSSAYVLQFSEHAKAKEDSNKHTTEPVEKKRLSLWFHAYALDLFRRGDITFRGAILLSMIDHHVNPWVKRHGRDPTAGERFVETRIGDLKHLLQCTDDTVYSTIRATASVRPAVLKYKRVGHTWLMKTIPDRENEDGSIHVKSDILDLWLSGMLGGCGHSMLILAKVLNLQEDDLRCFVSNKTFGKLIGTKEHYAKKLIGKLVRLKLLDASHEFSRGRTIRYLTVPNLSPKSIEARRRGSQNETPEFCTQGGQNSAIWEDDP
jgi:hypothetical protein